MSSISTVIITCDGAEYIEDSLRSVTWTSEVIVVDVGSKDPTVDICRKYTDKVFLHPHVPIAEYARNFAFTKASGDWILVIDQDEYVTAPLASALQNIASNASSDDAYYLFRTNLIFGRVMMHSGWGDDQLIRFFRQGTCNWSNTIHSVPEIKGSIGRLTKDDGCLLHDNYRTITQFIEKLNRYTDLETKRLHETGRPFHWLKLLYQPGKEFINQYVKRNGYKDGITGLILSILSAFYVQVYYMKLWELHDLERNDKARVRLADLIRDLDQGGRDERGEVLVQGQL